MEQNIRVLIDKLVDSNGVFGAPRKSDWEHGNAGCVLMKTCGKLRLFWDSQFIMVTDAETSDQTIKDSGPNYYYGKFNVTASKDVYGHTNWWTNTHRKLRIQVQEAQDKKREELSALFKLLD